MAGRSPNLARASCDVVAQPSCDLSDRQPGSQAPHSNPSASRAPRSSSNTNAGEACFRLRPSVNDAMDFSLDILALLTAAAFFAGIIDSMAGGGGLLTLPALLAAGVPPVNALATNKLQGALGTGGAFLAFLRKGHVDVRRYAWPAVGAFLGSVAGTIVVQISNPSLLAGLVPALLILIAIYFLIAPPMNDADQPARISDPVLTLLATGIGFYDGFFGPGTGSFFTTTLVALGGLGLVRAIATTKLLNFCTNVASLLAMAAGGKVLWLLGLTMAVANVVGNQVGANLAMRYGGRGVRPLLVIISLALTMKLLSDPENPARRLAESIWDAL